MAHYRLTRKADSDIESHFEYGTENFGLARAQEYLLELYERFLLLAENPVFGRDASELVTGLRRSEYGAHVIFYIPKEDHILVVRVLRKELDFPRHF